MEIKLAKTAGFCMGVRRAVDTVLDVAQHEKGRRIYTYGPLIHNPQTIELLKRRGITAISRLEDIPDKDQAVLIIRAHGIAPDERKVIKNSGVKIIDATCPKVGYVQAIIKKHTSLAYTVIIVGDRHHPEVDGLWGYTQGRGIIVSTVEDADTIQPLDKICIVAQTTQDTEHYRTIIEKIREKNPQAVVFETICSSTEKRQGEIITLAKEMDAVFVVGGKNSANTCRLADLAQKQGAPTYHIETAEEIKNLDLNPYKNIGVSAGASTPNWIIDQVMDSITETHASPHPHLGFILKTWLWAVRTDVFSALGAACLALAGMLLQKIPVDITSIAIAVFFVFAMHVLNRLTAGKQSGLIGSFRETSYLRHPKTYRLSAVASLIVALVLSLTTNLISFFLLFFISLAGGLYNMKILPGNRRFQRLRDIPGSKNFFTASAWGMVTAVLPALHASQNVNLGIVIAFLLTFTLVFTRSAMSDIMDIQSDKLMGRETIPVIIGKEKTQMLLKIILLILFIVLLISPFAGATSTLSYFLVLCILYIWICFRLCDRRAGLSGAVVEGLLETSYIIAGFAVLGWLIVGCVQEAKRMKGVKIMNPKFFTRLILVIIVLTTVACGGLRYSQLDPAANDYHPKHIAIFPADVGTYEEARTHIEQIVPGVLMDKKWFTDIVDTASLNRQIQANEELRKATTDYLSKLQTLNFSDSTLSRRIAELTKTDAFLLVAVDYWNYTVEKGDKLAKVSIGMKLIDASTGKIMWKAGHHRGETYMLIKPDLPDVARSVVKDMVKEMPH